MDAVNDLRDGKLRSWESVAKSMLKSGSDGALGFIAQRPGMMLRMVAWLMRLGYEKDDIVLALSEKASSLSMQTLVTNMNYFGKLSLYPEHQGIPSRQLSWHIQISLAL